MAWDLAGWLAPLSRAGGRFPPVRRPAVSRRVDFQTICPGWYPGRTPHIHFKVLLDHASLITGQLYLPDGLTGRVYASLSHYRERKARREVTNAGDFIFRRPGGAETILGIAEEQGAFRGALIISVKRKT